MVNRKISFVYFDVGGVAMLDFSGTNKWEEMRRNICKTDKNIALFNTIWERHKDRIAIDFDVDALIPILHKELGMKFPKKYSMLLDFVNRFETNPSILPALKTIHKNRRIGLLTNMYPRMFNILKKKGYIPSVDWDVIIDSSLVGYQKPDRKIFEIAQKQAGVSNEEILFVENSPEHVHAAQAVGWQTFLYDSSDPISASSKLFAMFRL